MHHGAIVGDEPDELKPEPKAHTMKPREERPRCAGDGKGSRNFPGRRLDGRFCDNGRPGKNKTES